MKKGQLFKICVTVAVLMQLLLALSIKCFPVIYYRWEKNNGVNLNSGYPSSTITESKRRGCFLSEFEGEDGIIGFLECQQYWRHGKVNNSKTVLDLVIDCRGNPALLEKEYTFPKDKYRVGRKLYFIIHGEEEGQAVTDTIVLSTVNDERIILNKISE